MSHLILVILALVCFGLAALGASVPRIGLVPLGLFFATLSTLV
jgi:hypothetical protein